MCYRETLPNGVSYITHDFTDNGFLDNTQVFMVPPGHYFMMGDNRDNSTDSRVLSPVGYVPFENLIGRAQIIFFSIRAARTRGRSGVGPGRCAGAGCSRWCDERPRQEPKLGLREPRSKSGAAENRPPRTRRRQSRRQSAEARPRRQKEPRRSRRGTALEERIGYRFNDGALLDCALTHISALKGARNRAGSYQRLEFLGDHVLGLVISDMLFRGFPKADEGELSRRLADLVRKETCAEIAGTIELGAAIKLGSSEANAGGRKRPAILADVCEALIGAVYLDGGYPAAEVWSSGCGRRACGRRRSRCAIRRPCCRNGRRRAACRRRPIAKSRAPVPTTVRNSASPCSCRISPPAEGSGRSKRAAEQAAAAAMLSREGVKPERRNG